MLTQRNDAALRGYARRRGYEIRKSRRAFGPSNWGGYMVVDPDTNFCAIGQSYDLSADEVREWLADCKLT